MMTDDCISVKVHGSNKEHYSRVLGTDLLSGQLITIKQSQLPITSRVKVKCICDLCEKEFTRTRKDVKDVTLCSKDCRNEYLKSVNPNRNIDKIKVNCNICKKEFNVTPSKYNKQEYFLCSRDCYSSHRSVVYNTDKIYNYQDLTTTCSNEKCNKKIKTIEYNIKNNNHIFCSQECYWIHRKTHYSEFYYVENLNSTRKETEPEKKVRLFLDKNGIDYIQEYNILNYFVDFYLPSFNSVIEVYGDYWHCNPDVYGYEVNKRELHKNQIGVWEYDKKRVNEILNFVNNVHIIWEKDIKENFDNVMGNVIEKILNKNP